MTKGWLGRSRAPSTTDRPNDNIGQPTLTFTDAEPRHDLQSLGKATPFVHFDDQQPTGKAYHVLERPKTSTAQSKSFSTDFRPALQTYRSYDFDAIREGVAPDEASIGMALGSPSHPPAQMTLPSLSPSPLAVYQSAAEMDGDDHNKHRNGKWKKLGGFFKAKSALAQYAAYTTPVFSHPPAQMTSSPDTMSAPYNAISNYPVTTENEFPGDIPKKARHIIGGPSSTGRNRGDSVDSNNHPRNGSIEGPRARSLSRSRARTRSDAATKVPKAVQEALNPAPPPTPPKDLTSFQNSSLFLTGLPSLDIEIPDAHMERYSIMFSGVLGSNSSNLLARRSRMLDKLRMISDEAEMTQTEPVPEIPANMKESTMLAPKPQTRRATSPGRKKDSNFSLFPTQTAASDKTIGNGNPPPLTRLQRSFTAPSGPSPVRDTFNLDNGSTIKEVESETEINSSETTASTPRPKWSSDQSYLSPTSTISSVNQENDILFDVKALSLYENDEPQWEIISTDKVHEVDPTTRRLRRPVQKPSALSSHPSNVETLDWPEFPLPNANNEALAALEAPVPIGQDIAPLGASKAAVDRIMSPPPMEGRPTSSTKHEGVARQDVVIPKLRVRGRTVSHRPISQAPTVSQSNVPMKPLLTAVTNDLEQLEQQIESRAVRAMKKQAKARANQADRQSSTSPPRAAPPRSLTHDGTQGRSSPILSINRQPVGITKVRSVDNIASKMQGQSPKGLPPRPPLIRQETIVRQESPLDSVRTMSPPPLTSGRSQQDSPSDLISPRSEVAEVQVARSISVSQRSKQMLVPIGNARQDSKDNLVERTAQGPLTPQIIDADSPTAFGKVRGHRPEKSHHLIVEHA